MNKTTHSSRPRTLCTLALLFIGLQACSTLDAINPFSSSEGGAPVTETEPSPETSDAADAALRAGVVKPRPVETEDTSTIEVFWHVPADAVEKYHLYYGLNRSKLDNHIVLPVSELEKIDHPKHGPVYRYRLKQIPAKHAIYLSMSAENQGGQSDPSPITKIEPGQLSVTP